MVFVSVAQRGDMVFVRFDNAPSKMDDVTQYLLKIKEVYDKGRPFVIVYDARDIAMLERKYIQVQIDFMREQRERTKDLMIRAAVVVNGQAMRMFLNTAVFAIQPPACHLEVFDDLDSAKQFVGKLLDRTTKKFKRSK